MMEENIFEGGSKPYKAQPSAVPKMASKIDDKALKQAIERWNSGNGNKLTPDRVSAAIAYLTRFAATDETSAKLIPFDTLIEKSMWELDATDASECVSTGYPWLDDKIVGLFKSELMVVGGETGLGKTTFVTSICYKAARRGIKTAVFALEDRLSDYGIKAVYFELGRIRKRKGYPHNYPWNAYRKNEITDPQYKTLRKEAEEAVKTSDLFFADVPTQMTIESLEKIIANSVEKGVKLFLIDHLHYFDMMKGDKSKADYIEEMMVRLKSLMNRTGARVILVVHYKKLDGKKPTVESFKDSISIPQNANYVVNIWRDRSESGSQFETTFYLPKVRNPNGEATIKLSYDPDENEYRDLDSHFGSPQGETAQIAGEISL